MNRSSWLYVPLRASYCVIRMALQDHGLSDADDELPVVAIYHCLLCDEGFSTKPELQIHYAKIHEKSIPDYRVENIIRL